MFSKFKKVLVSLALASSLALAPMNVSAVTTLTESNSDGKTKVYAIGSQFFTKYTVEVPDAVTIDLNERKCNVDDLSITLKEAEDFNGQNLRVTPSFSLLKESSPMVAIKYGTNNSGDIVKLFPLSDIFRSNNLLQFGTKKNNQIEAGSGVTTFAESERSAVKKIGLIVDEDEAMEARKAVPPYGKDFATGDTPCDPQIVGDKQIGIISYTLEMLQSDSSNVPESEVPDSSNVPESSAPAEESSVPAEESSAPAEGE